MKLYIPACGDRLHLTAPWNFILYLESRNIQFAKLRGLVNKEGRWSIYEEGPVLKSGPVTLPAGSVIECDRVYIRSFNKSRVQIEKDYDSITWKLMQTNGKPVRHGRFWVKLPDCYDIEYELQSDSLYRHRVKAIREVMES